MAEAALFSIAGGIINSVAGPLVAQEVKLFCGAKGELDKLAHTLSTIKAVLVDAEERQAKSEPIRLLLEMLSDLLYEADDLLDAVSTETQRRKIKTQHKKAKRLRLFFSRSNQFAFRLKMAHKIKSIRDKLDAIADEMKIHQFVMRPEEPPITVSKRDSTFSFVIKENVIGRESDKEEVIKRLLDTNVEGNISILPIIGIGGLGKTTLAQLVYNDEKIQSHFKPRVWVCVSDPFNLEDVVEKMLDSLGGKKSNSMDVMINDLKAKIDKKKYLFVLDDVWNEDAEQWSNLERVLIGGVVGSKILVTTRSELVAKIMFSRNPYNLRGLGDPESLNLLKQMAFPNGEWPENPRFQELGKEIIKKCVGVPLAIRTLGRMLHLKNSVEEWLNFVKNDLPNIEKDKSGILSTLRFSYNKLPSHLKCCFAYCSTYPKDYEYDKTTIIHEWIAHGFIESKNQCLEDVGNDYFMELLWRSFLQDPKENDDHVIIGCKMHDLMHDLATSVMARSLITTSDEKKWKINEKTRHLLIDKYLKFPVKELISQCGEKMMIRTFHCPKFGGEIDYELIFSNFKFLRVLNLSRNDLEHVPNTIGKLKHLRYLNLSRNRKIKVLPSSFTKLVNLQFLDLSYCWALTGLPRGIKNLVNLKCLDLYDCSKMKYLSHGLRKSTSLQWLKEFQVDSDSPSSDNASLSEFKELNKLGGSLIIWNLRHSKDVVAEYKAANIKKKTGLKSLKLHFSSSDEDHDNDVKDESILEVLQPHANLMELEMDSCRSVTLPSWILLITGLVKLRLFGCKSCQYLTYVNQLRFLKELYLQEMNDLVYISNCSEFCSSSLASIENSFQSLFEITFLDCPKLKGWLGDSSLMVDSDSRLLSFPVLSKVLIKRCSMLTFLPLPPQMCFLKEINLKKMDALEYLFDCDRSEFSPSSSTSTEDFFSSLSKICFEECPKLKGWWRDSPLEVDCDNGTHTLPLFPQLSEVRIRNCPQLASLPLSLQSNLLEEVSLIRINDVQYVFNNNWSGSLASVKAFCPSLSKIKIHGCSKLKGWWRDFSLDINHTLPLFPELSSIDIANCPLLTYLPLSPHIESLQMPAGTTNSALAASSYAPLSKLKKITLFNLSGLETLQEEGLIYLTSLKRLSIYGCLKLKSLSLGIQHLTALENLTIGNCSELDLPSDEHGTCWEGFKSLLFLHVENLSKWGSLPSGLQQVNTLQQLSILNCENLTTILESIHHWKSLKEVTIQNCPHLIELPKGIQSLSSLQKLEISKCPKLKSLPSKIQYLTALKYLTIGNCPELEPLSDECGKCWEGLKSLIYLTVEKLSKWVSLPLGLQQVSILQRLQILDCENLTTILESIHHWKSLKEVTIQNCPHLIELPEGIQSLSSLQKLEISKCSKLKSLPPEIQHLTTLKGLTISNCSELNPPSDECGMCWEGLESLLVLRVENLSKWGSLPLGLQQVGTLRVLSISECESLTTILESIHLWKTLEILRISNCPCLIELPEGIQSLSTLRSLLIKGCPILLQKYKKDGGVNWSKIAHIPKLELDCNSVEEGDFNDEFSRMESLCLQ